jgi:hypothetical protein
MQYYLIREIERTFAPLLSNIPEDANLLEEEEKYNYLRSKNKDYVENEMSLVFLLYREKLYKETKEYIVENLKEFINEQKENNEQFENKILEAIHHEH